VTESERESEISAALEKEQQVERAEREADIAHEQAIDERVAKLLGGDDTADNG
jgi:hypothetical protein